MGFWDFGRREGIEHPPVPSFRSCLLTPPLPLISCFPHPWPQILLSLFPTFQCGAHHFEEPSTRRSTSLLLTRKSLNLQSWTIPQRYAKSINPGCLAGFHLPVFGSGVDCLEWGWWGLKLDKAYIKRRLCWWLRRCSFWGQKLLFYYWGIRCSDTKRTCKYLCRADQLDNIHSTFLCIQIFYMHIPYALERIPL